MLECEHRDTSERLLGYARRHGSTPLDETSANQARATWAPGTPEIDPSRIVRGLLDRLGRIVLVGLLLGAAGAFVVLQKVDNKWTAAVRMQLREPAEVLGDTRLAGSYPVPRDARAFEDLVRDDRVVGRVLRRVQGVSPTDVRQAIGVEGYNAAPMVGLRATARTAEGAAQLANAIAESFIEEQQALLVARVQAERQAQRERVEAAQKRVVAAQDAVTEFVERNGLQDDTQIGLLAQRARALDDRVAELEATMAAGRERLELLTAKLEGESEVLRTATVVPGTATTTPAAERLRLVRMHEALQAGGNPAAVTPASPKGVTTTSVAPNPVRQSLRMSVIQEESNLRAAQAEMDAVLGWRTEVRRQQAQVPNLQREFQALQVQRDFANEDLREALVAQAAIDRVGDSPRPLVEIAAAASPPDEPDRPLREMLTVAAMAAGFVFSVLGGLLIELRDTRVRAPDELRRSGLPVLATLPDLRKDPAGWEEGVRQIAFDLRRRAQRAGSYSVVVTSSRPQEGKTRVARTLTHVCAEWGLPVLRLDANLRDAPSGPPLLEAFLEGQSDGPLVRRLADGVCTVTNAGPRDDAVTLLAGERLPGLMRSASRIFSLAVVDAPAVLPSVDAELLGQSADGVILVIAAGHTRHEEVSAAMERLIHAGANVIGAVLTGVRRAWVAKDEHVAPLATSPEDKA